MGRTATAILDGERVRAPGPVNDNAPPAGHETWNLNYHRYYDPAVGRYTQEDPLLSAPRLGSSKAKTVERTLLPYAYALNNPVALADPTGLDVYLFDDGVHWGVGFDLECNNTCDPDPYIARVDYYCKAYRGGGGTSCGWSSPGGYDYNEGYLSDLTGGSKVMRCEANCARTHAALDRALQRCGRNYSFWFGNSCRDIVVAALIEAGCRSAFQPPRLRLPLTY